MLEAELPVPARYGRKCSSFAGLARGLVAAYERMDGAPARIFFLLAYLVSLGMLVGDRSFAHWGIPLPGLQSQLLHQPVKLYVFEIFLFCTAMLAGWGFRRNAAFAVRTVLSPLGLLLLVLFVVGMLRMAIELPGTPFVLLRSSAFVWYLSLPLLIPFVGIRARDIEALFQGTYYALFACFTAGLIAHFFGAETRVDWYPALGVSVFLYLWLNRNDAIAWFFFVALGTALGFGLAEKVQRTSLLCLFLAIALAVAAGRHRGFRWLKLGLLLLAMAGTYGSQKQFFSHPPDRSNWGPWKKSESNALGLEAFRYEMWADAWSLFRERPLAGIGFRRQVVYRMYAGGGVYLPNDGTFPVGGDTTLAPVAGPHNSYLNAVARMGVLGALFLVAHIWAFWILWRRDYPFAAFAALGQILYAFFNVGLEGPVRSFWILLALAAALLAKYSPEERAPALDRKAAP